MLKKINFFFYFVIIVISALFINGCFINSNPVDLKVIKVGASDEVWKNFYVEVYKLGDEATLLGTAVAQNQTVVEVGLKNVKDDDRLLIKVYKMDEKGNRTGEEMEFLEEAKNIDSVTVSPFTTMMTQRALKEDDVYKGKAYLAKFINNLEQKSRSRILETRSSCVYTVRTGDEVTDTVNQLTKLVGVCHLKETSTRVENTVKKLLGDEGLNKISELASKENIVIGLFNQLGTVEVTNETIYKEVLSDVGVPTDVIESLPSETVDLVTQTVTESLEEIGVTVENEEDTTEEISKLLRLVVKALGDEALTVDSFAHKFALVLISQKNTAPMSNLSGVEDDADELLVNDTKTIAPNLTVGDSALGLTISENQIMLNSYGNYVNPSTNFLDGYDTATLLLNFNWLPTFYNVVNPYYATISIPLYDFQIDGYDDKGFYLDLDLVLDNRYWVGSSIETYIANSSNYTYPSWEATAIVHIHLKNIKIVGDSANNLSFDKSTLQMAISTDLYSTDYKAVTDSDFVNSSIMLYPVDGKYSLLLDVEKIAEMAEKLFPGKITMPVLVMNYNASDDKWEKNWVQYSTTLTDIGYPNVEEDLNADSTVPNANLFDAVLASGAVYIKGFRSLNGDSTTSVYYDSSEMYNKKIGYNYKIVDWDGYKNFCWCTFLSNAEHFKTTITSTEYATKAIVDDVNNIIVPATPEGVFSETITTSGGTSTCFNTTIAVQFLPNLIALNGVALFGFPDPLVNQKANVIVDIYYYATRSSSITSSDAVDWSVLPEIGTNLHVEIRNIKLIATGIDPTQNIYIDYNDGSTISLGTTTKCLTIAGSVLNYIDSSANAIPIIFLNNASGTAAVNIGNLLTALDDNNDGTYNGDIDGDGNPDFYYYDSTPSKQSWVDSTNTNYGDTKRDIGDSTNKGLVMMEVRVRLQPYNDEGDAIPGKYTSIDATTSTSKTIDMDTSAYMDLKVKIYDPTD